MGITSIKPLAVILTKDSDWYRWIALLETSAHTGKVWPYINPSNPEGVALLDSHKEPQYEDVHESATTAPVSTTTTARTVVKFSDLTSEEAHEFQRLCTRYEARDQSLRDIGAVIQASIHENLFSHTMNCNSAREMLINLKAQVCASDAVRERQLIAEYNQLKTISPTESIETWIVNFQAIYNKCMEIKAPDVQGNRPQFDMIRALKSRMSGFYNAWYFRLLEENHGITILILVERLRDYLRDNAPINQRGRHTAFAAFQDSDQSDQTSKPDEPYTVRPCVCGGRHWYSECRYLIPSNQYKGWTPNPEIQKAIQSKIAKSPRLQANIQRAKKRVQDQLDKEASFPLKDLSTALLATAFQVHQPESTWPLYNSFIFDSGATTHICHTRSRFRNFRAISEQLHTAGSPLEIQGYGDVDITVQGVSKARKITLLNTAYIPACTTNLVSSFRFLKGGVTWDQLNSRLMQGPNIWCMLTQLHNLSVVAYEPTPANQHALLSRNDLQRAINTPSFISQTPSSFPLQTEPAPKPKGSPTPIIVPRSGRFIKSTLPSPAEQVTLRTIHERFAHPGLETTKQLAKHTTGLLLIQYTQQEEDQIKTCEVCRLAKGTKLIARTPVKTPTRPYEVVSCDLLEFKKVNEDAGYGKWVLHFHCNYSGMNHVYVLPQKEERVLLSTLQEFCAYTQRRWNQPIVILHTDGETGFGSTTAHWLAQQGISLHRSPPYTPDQNGAAERSGGVIIKAGRTLLIESRFPGYMWPEAISAAGYLLNRTPRQKYSWKSPLERLQAYLGITDPQPKVQHIRIYGCRAYPLIQNQLKLNKLGPRTSIGYLVGWDSTNIFRIWIPTLQKVIRTRDVTFDEQHKYDPNHIILPIPQEVLQAISTIEIISLPQYDGVTTDQIIPNLTPRTSDTKASKRTKQKLSKSKTGGVIQENVQANTPIQEATPPPEPAEQASLPPAGDTSPDSSASTPANPPNIELSSSDHASLPPAAPPQDQASPNASNTTPPHQISHDAEVFNPETDPELSRDIHQETTITVNSPTTQPPRSTTRAAYDTSQGVDPSNILSQPRTRKPRKEAYFAALDSNDLGVGYHKAFLAGTQFSANQRLHRSDLPSAPTNWKQVESHAHSIGFRDAAKKEYNDLETRGTWQLVDQSEATTRPLPLKWVFTYKYDTDGFLERYKARICVRGDLQPTNEKDSYAATLAAKVFRSLMAITARFDLEAVQVDAINAFINGQLDEEVYTYFPEGFKVPGKLLQLKRALYGLRRSPLLWLQELSSALKGLGFQPIPEAQCLFTNGRIIVFFYVDDIVILYHKRHQPEFIQFKQALLAKYEFKDLGELKWFLGIRVIRNRQEQKLWLCQDSYIEKVTTSFNLLEHGLFKTPLQCEELSTNEEQATPQEIHAYQSRIGSTTYATSITRPDAARASNKLAEFLLNPSPAHMKAANRLIKYLYDTRHLALEYSASTTEPEFRCATDAAFGDDADTRKSTEGYLFKLFGGPIDWKSTRQKLVVKSSTEAELVALSHASTEIYWWRRFFTQIQLQLEEYKVECDNQQTIRLITTPAIKLATKLKHIDIHHHWLRQEVLENSLQLKWIPTNNMPADGFTKALPTQKHQAFIRQLGLTDIQHLIKA